ncbi:MAG TPA: hypothetical protein VF679_01055 [Pedobacter sp.]
MKLLALEQLPNTRSPATKTILRHFVLPLEPPGYYPRIHFVAVQAMHGMFKVDIHADMQKHIDVNYYHPKIDKILNLIKNS